jgi:V/A-type H+-transporting ATPase subunit D
MGVKIPDIHGRYVAKTTFERGYGIVGTSAKIDEAAGAFEECLGTVIELAKTENALLKLLREIEKTKRRVNALEYVVLPTLKSQSKYISMRLDEMERETFFTLKTIKKKLGKKVV